MNRNDQFRHQDWDNAPLSEREDGSRQGPGGPPEPESKPLSALLLHAGIWAAGCLLIASAVPPVLTAPLLRELLVMSAFAVSMIGLLRGETLTLKAFNRQDAAVMLLGLGMVAAFFIDHAAVRAYIEANDLGGAAGASDAVN